MTWACQIDGQPFGTRACEWLLKWDWVTRLNLTSPASQRGRDEVRCVQRLCQCMSGVQHTTCGKCAWICIDKYNCLWLPSENVTYCNCALINIFTLLWLNRILSSFLPWVLSVTCCVCVCVWAGGDCQSAPLVFRSFLLLGLDPTLSPHAG